jgi:hypothetical protein
MGSFGMSEMENKWKTGQVLMKGVLSCFGEQYRIIVL